MGGYFGKLPSDEPLQDPDVPKNFEQFIAESDAAGFDQAAVFFCRSYAGVLVGLGFRVSEFTLWD